MIQLRHATPSDLEILQYWDNQQHVIDSDPFDDWNWEDELTRALVWREQLIAELDGRAIGFVQIINPAQEESHYWGDIAEGFRAIDIWIGLENDLGRGYGTEIMHLALVRCFSNPDVIGVLIDPLVTNVRAIKFYETMGFEFIEHRKFGDSDCKVYYLNRAAWELKTSLG